MSSADDLRAMSRALHDAKAELVSLCDRLTLDCDSPAAKQYRFTREGPFGSTVTEMRANSRSTIWELSVGSPMKCYVNDVLTTPGNAPKVLSIISEEVQPAAITTREWLSRARDEAETLATMTAEDLDALASIPAVLGENNESLGEISEALERDINLVTELQDRVNEADANGRRWSGEGKDAYYAALTPQKVAFQECQQNVERLLAADIALAEITGELFVAFLNLRSEQLAAASIAATVIMGLDDPTEWVGWAQKLANGVISASQDQIRQFQATIRELADSAETSRVIESAERTASMDWPVPPAGIAEDWTK